MAVQLLARLIISISGHFGRERGERLDNEYKALLLLLLERKDLLNLKLHLLPIQRQETMPEIERKGFCLKRWKWCSILAKQFVMECRGEGAGNAVQ